jgi:hypothetical protein
MKINTNLLALLTVLAVMAAVPQAIAATPEVDPEAEFPVSALANFFGAQISTAGGTVGCSGGFSGSSQLTNNTTKEATYSFGGCKFIGVNCTSEGQSAGTIKFGPVLMHYVYLDEKHTKPGVLATPPASGLFAKFTCAGVPFEIKGNGLLAEVTAPACGQSSKTESFVAQAASPGTQKYLQVEETGAVYDMTATVAGGAPETASLTVGISETGQSTRTLTCPEQK